MIFTVRDSEHQAVNESFCTRPAVIFTVRDSEHQAVNDCRPVHPYVLHPICLCVSPALTGKVKVTSICLYSVYFVARL